ncbi:hypothetical protein L596_025350 [Steinernema carpocapsae]|uniref:Uncharacterized protein n=1 Tax=Steinernema carpocapsae TaxID=34508 RepID=A0A4U5M8D1_STECR|nr:hypothetical protein L596_025350 [Steinernema carpocapsae]
MFVSRHVKLVDMHRNRKFRVCYVASFVHSKQFLIYTLSRTGTNPKKRNFDSGSFGTEPPSLQISYHPKKCKLLFRKPRLQL